MLLSQIKKSIILTTNTFLVIFLLSYHVQVQAEGTDRSGMAHTLWEQGKSAFNEKDYQLALDKFSDCLTIYKETGDRQSEADLLTWMATVNIEINEFDKALDCLKESKEIYGNLNSKPGEKAHFKDVDKTLKAFVLYTEGRQYLDAKDYESAINKMREALHLVREMGIKRYEKELLMVIMVIEAEPYLNIKDYESGTDYLKAFGLILIDQGVEYARQENHSEALIKFKHALSIFEVLGREIMTALTIEHIGASFSSLKDYQEALKYQQRALEIYEKAGEGHRAKKAGVLCEIGEICHELKDYQKALQHYHQALMIFLENGDQGKFARTTTLLSDTYVKLGYIPLEYYKQVSNIIQEVGSHPGGGLFLLIVGSHFYHAGEYAEALKAFSKAIYIFKELNGLTNHQRRVQGRVLLGIGKVYMGMADYLKAIDSLKGALEVFEGLENKIGQQDTLKYLSNVYTLLGDHGNAKDCSTKILNIEQFGYQTKVDQLTSLINQGIAMLQEKKFDKALDIHQQALSLSKELNDKIGEEQSLYYMGNDYLRLKEYPKALEYFDRSLKVSREFKRIDSEKSSLYGIAMTYWLQQDYVNARYYCKQAIGLNKDKVRSLWDVECYGLIGLTYSKQKKHEKAAASFEIALAMSEDMGLLDKIWRIQSELGFTAGSSGQLQNARNYFSKAIDTIESIRGNISVAEYKTSFMGNKLSVYVKMVYVLLQLKEDEEAFNYVERAKSRTLLDMLGNRVKLEKGKDKEVSQEERKQQRRITELLEKVQNEQSQPREKQRAVLPKWKKELERAREKYAEFLLRVKLENSELASLVSVNPLTLKEVQNLLDTDTTLLEYAIFDNGIAIWVVDRSNCNLVTELIPYTALHAKISAFREKISSLQTDYEKEAEELYDLLIRRAKPYIKTKRICIVPHIVLHYLPFQALLNVPAISGIGAMLNMNEGILTVASTVEGISAYKAGIEAGDKIMAIDGSPTINMSLTEVVSKLRGEPSTSVLLEVVSEESETSKTIKLIRENVMKSSIYSQFYGSNTTDKNNEVESKTSFLIEEYDISYSPSASVLKFVLEKRKKITGKVLAFANPDLGDENLNLPHAEEEVRNIKESYPDTAIYMNENATEEKVKLLSGNYNIIHFASHGELNPQSPLFSCIRLAKEKDEDGRLELHEIFNLNLENTSLVTLSACETGLGTLLNGDELIGLTRGFIYAGTPSIVASLWNVNDKSTSDLMNLFYKNLKTHSKVEALRMAQLEMINGEVGRGIVRGVGGITASNEEQDNPQSQMTVNGSHPYFWAPFILLGDWQ